MVSLDAVQGVALDIPMDRAGARAAQLRRTVALLSLRAGSDSSDRLEDLAFRLRECSVVSSQDGAVGPLTEHDAVLALLCSLAAPSFSSQPHLEEGTEPASSSLRVSLLDESLRLALPAPQQHADATNRVHKASGSTERSILRLLAGSMMGLPPTINPSGVSPIHSAFLRDSLQCCKDRRDAEAIILCWAEPQPGSAALRVLSAASIDILRGCDAQVLEMLVEHEVRWVVGMASRHRPIACHVKDFRSA